MTQARQAFTDHLKAASFVDLYERQLAYELRTSKPLAEVGNTRRSLRYWQQRLDSIECPS